MSRERIEWLYQSDLTSLRGDLNSGILMLHVRALRVRGETEKDIRGEKNRRVR